MQLSQRFVLFLRTLNPDVYPKLCEELSLSSAMKQFIFTFLFLFALMLILFVPAILVGAPKLTTAINSFDSFVLDANVSGNQPVVILKDPRVVIDLGENATMDDKTLLLTKTGVEWRRWYLFGHSSKPWSEVRDAKGYSENFYIILLLFMVPSIAFWLGMLLLLKYLFLIFVTSLLMFFIPRLWRFTITFANTCKVALFSATIMLLVEMILFPFARILWLPILLYLLFLVIGVTIVGDRDFDDHPKKKGHGKRETWE